MSKVKQLPKRDQVKAVRLLESIESLQERCRLGNGLQKMGQPDRRFREIRREAGR